LRLPDEPGSAFAQPGGETPPPHVGGGTPNTRGPASHASHVLPNLPQRAPRKQSRTKKGQ
jgi:hypothetical protein